MPAVRTCRKAGESGTELPTYIRPTASIDEYVQSGVLNPSIVPPYNEASLRI